MLDRLIEEVQAAVVPTEIMVGGILYTTKPVYRLPSDDPPKALRVQKLQSIVDYILGGVDQVGVDSDVFIHVESPTQVSLNRHIRNGNIRDALIVATYEAPKAFQFDQRYEQGEFITRLQAQFAATGGRERVLKFVASLSAESSLRLQDDGVKQETSVKKGITTLAVDAFENPVILTPFRTFAEVDQPESNFILRLHSRDGEAPTISLHEAENDKWKIEAVTNIAVFFSDKQLGSIATIA